MPWTPSVVSFVAVLAGDLATKALVTRELGGGRVVELPLGVRLEHGENSGVAFGLLAGSGDLVLIVALVAVTALAMLLILLRSTAAAALAAAALLAGALANLVDRAGDGAVTDFIDLGAWPSFNLADVAITTGVALLALTLARRPPANSLQPSPPRLPKADPGSTAGRSEDRA